MIRIRIDEKVFVARKATLEQSDFFKGLLEISEESEIIVDRDPKAFKHVLYYLRDPHYRIPSKYLYEIGYYLFDYPMYSSRDKEFVEVFTQNTSHRLRADLLINSSVYLQNIFCKLYVGTPVYLDITPRQFKHVLRLIEDINYIPPMKYKKVIEKFELKRTPHYLDSDIVKIKCTNGILRFTIADIKLIWREYNSPWKEGYKGRIPFPVEHVEEAFVSLSKGRTDKYKDVLDFLGI